MTSLNSRCSLMSGHWAFLEHYGYIEAASWTLPTANEALPALAPLPSLGSWTLSGRSARDFLQGYVASDLAAVSDTDWSITCFCSIQGRVLASAFVSGNATRISFVMREDMIDPLLDSLKKFLAFARDCTLEREATNIFGWVGDAPEGVEIQQVDLPARAALGLLCVSSDQAEARWKALRVHARQADEHLWRRCEIEAGFADVSPAVRGEFLPQMLGLDRLGAVSFTKGCYLGQEVVTRAAHRGKIKRSLMRLDVHTPPKQPMAPGTKLKNEAGRDAGMLVVSAPKRQGDAGYTGLAVLNRDTGPSVRISGSDQYAALIADPGI